MEIITIEKVTYDHLLRKIGAISSRLDLISECNQEKSLQPWLDSQDVCNILRLTKRQLQTYRENGKLSYSKIEHKIYYRPQDIQTLIDKHIINSSCLK